jgi:hypothetical protein
MCSHIIDRILDGPDFLCILVRNFDAESLFNLPASEEDEDEE